MNKKIVFAIVGVGYWGPNYLRILHALKDTEVKWVCDIDKTALHKVSQDYKNVKVTSDLNEVLSDGTVNCIAVITPARNHYEIVKRCLRSGKHVLVEKPMTLSTKEAGILTQIADKKSLHLAVDHTYKFNPAIKELKKIANAKNFGKVYYAYGLYNAFGPIRRDVSALWDLSIHFLYVINYLLGSIPTTLSSRGKSFLMENIEDVVISHFEYPGNILFTLHTSWLDPSKTRRLVIVGSRKMVIFDDVATDGKIKIFDKFAQINENPHLKRPSFIMHDKRITIPTIGNSEPLFEAISDFVRAVKRGTKPFVDGKEGEEIVKILSFAQKSINKNGTVMRL